MDVSNWLPRCEMVQKECIVIITSAFVWSSYSTTTLALCQKFNIMRPQSFCTAIIEEWWNLPSALLTSDLARFNLWTQLKRLTWCCTIILHWGYRLLSFLQDINPTSSIADPHKLARDSHSSLDLASVSSNWWNSLHLYTTWIMLPSWLIWRSRKLKTLSCNGITELTKWRGHLLSCHFMFILLTCLYAWHKVANMKHAMSLNFYDIHPVTSLSMRKLTYDNMICFRKTMRTIAVIDLGAKLNIFFDVAQHVIKQVRRRIQRLLCNWSKNII